MDNLLWGLQTTVLGMGLVFGLLALMWGLLTLALRLDKPLEPQPPATARTPPDPEPATAPGLDGETVAAILIATLTHRAQRRREAAPAMRSYWPGQPALRLALGRSGPGQAEPRLDDGGTDNAALQPGPWRSGVRHRCSGTDRRPFRGVRGRRAL